MPSDGGQSSKTRSKRPLSRTGWRARRNPVQVVFQPRQLKIGGAKIYFAGDDLEPLESGGFDFFQQGSISEQNLVGTRAGYFLDAHAAGGIGLRVQVKEQYPLTGSGKAGGEIDGGGGLSHATFLIGDSDDFGWH